MLRNRAKLRLSRQRAISILQKAVDFVTKMNVGPAMDTAELLLEETHGIIEKEFASMNKTSTSKEKPPAQGNQQWPDQHLKQLSDAGVPASKLLLPEEMRQSRWYALLLVRA